MAIKKCKECGKEVSTKADLCPHCGATQKSKGLGCGGVLLFLIVMGFVVSQFNQCTKEAEESKEAAQKVETSLLETKRLLEESKREYHKRAIEKKTFEESIENHYAQVIEFTKQEQLDSALAEINLFRKFGKANYKDINQYYKTITTKSLSAKVKKIPASEVEENLRIYRKLLVLNPTVELYKNKIEHYQKKYDKVLDEQQENDKRALCDLEILSSHWKKDYGYAIYEGQVKNISGVKLKRVQAVATWHDKNGNMITSDTSIIEYNPILPGQSSPFKVMERWNPAMKTASIEFSYLGGGTIKTYKK